MLSLVSAGFRNVRTGCIREVDVVDKVQRSMVVYKASTLVTQTPRMTPVESEWYWNIALPRRGSVEVAMHHLVLMKAIVGVIFSKPMDLVMVFSVFSVSLQPYKDKRQNAKCQEYGYCRPSGNFTDIVANISCRDDR